MLRPQKYGDAVLLGAAGSSIKFYPLRAIKWFSDIFSHYYYADM
jgi:hypothetical protein